MSLSSLRLWMALRCWKEMLDLGGLARRRAALTPSLSASADLWSVLCAVAGSDSK